MCVCVDTDYYCPLYQTEGNNSVETLDLCDDVLAPTMFDSVMNDMKTLGGASMLTEWGECFCLQYAQSMPLACVWVGDGGRCMVHSYFL